MKSIFFSVVGIGLLAMGAEAQPASRPAPAAMEASGPSTEPDATEATASVRQIAPPADLEDDDSGDYMKHMSPSELEKLYAQHDAEVARLMAAAPDENLAGRASLVDPLTGQSISIDLVAF